MRMIVRAALAVTLFGTAAGTAVMLAPGSAWAEEPKVSHDVGAPLNDAVKAAQANDFPTALADVKKAQATTDRTPFDDYKINSILAYIYIQMKDYAAATPPTEAAADSPVIPDAEKQSAYHNALLLAAEAKDYKKAIAYGQQLKAIAPLDESIETTLAQAYYLTNDFANAQQYAQMSIDAAKAAGQAPNQACLEIVMSTQAKQNNQAGAQATLEQIAVSYNRPDDWSQLIDIALSTKGVRDPDALYLLRLKMLIPGALHSDDITALASVAEQQGYPTEGYAVLQKGISSGKITAGQAGALLAKTRGEANTDQRELPQIEAAAERSKTGQEDIKLAEDYWGYGRYADATNVAQRAIGKGGMKDPTEGTTLLGMLDVVQGKYDDAIQQLGQVQGSAARNATAHLWSLYAQAQKKQAQPPAAATAPAQQ